MKMMSTKSLMFILISVFFFAIGNVSAQSNMKQLSEKETNQLRSKLNSQPAEKATLVQKKEVKAVEKVVEEKTTKPSKTKAESAKPVKGKTSSDLQKETNSETNVVELKEKESKTTPNGLKSSNQQKRISTTHINSQKELKKKQ